LAPNRRLPCPPVPTRRVGPSRSRARAMSSLKSGETPKSAGEHGNASSSTRTGGTSNRWRDKSEWYVPKENEKVEIWSKTSGNWLDGVVVQVDLAMVVKITVEYTIPDVGRAQKTLVPSSVNLRTERPPVQRLRFAETVAATGCEEVEYGEDDAEEEEVHEECGDRDERDEDDNKEQGEGESGGEDEHGPREEPQKSKPSSAHAAPAEKGASTVSKTQRAEESVDGDDLSEGDVVADGRFELHHQLGSGSFSIVRLAKDLETGDEVALKIEPSQSKYPQLIEEARRYKHFAGGVGLPKMHWYGTDAGYNIMAMDLLGPSLEVMLDRSNRSMSLETVVALGAQMLGCLEFIHCKDFIHRDLKPNNFCLGHGDKSKQAFCIDFGLAKRYRSPASLGHAHIPFRGSLPFVGTVRYASVGAQLGEEQSRRDDLQALGYVFLYLLKGSLPWQGLAGTTNKDARRQMILEMKQALSSDDICAGVPVEFADYMDYVQELGFEKTPDYEHLRGLLQEALAQQRAAEVQGQPPHGKGAALDELRDGDSAVSER